MFYISYGEDEKREKKILTFFAKILFTQHIYLSTDIFIQIQSEDCCWLAVLIAVAYHIKCIAKISTTTARHTLICI